MSFGVGVGVASCAGVSVTPGTDASTSAGLEDVSLELLPIVSEISVMTIIAAKKYMIYVNILLIQPFSRLSLLIVFPPSFPPCKFPSQGLFCRMR